MQLSIITINYNNIAGLKKTVESVERQTVKDFEWVVIDGGSTDGSKEFIEQHAHSFDYWVSEPDRGIYNAMNKGIRVAQGDYFLFLNSGDYFASDKVVEKILPELTGEDYIMGDVASVNAKDITLSIQDVSELLSVGVDFFYNSSTHHQGMFIKKETLKAIPYNESRKMVADWEHSLIQLVKNKGSYKTVDFLISNVLEGGFSASDPARLNMERRMVRKEHFSDSPLVIDKKYIDAFYAEGSKKAFAQISMFAVYIFLERRYDMKTWQGLVVPYKQIVTKYGSFPFRCVNWLNLHGLSFISNVLVKIKGY